MTMQNVLLFDQSVHYGEVIRHWRKEVIKCTASSLLEVYNETFGTEYSKRWWERMEKNNKLPTDIDRRLVIAAMLNIPFTDLGIRLPPRGRERPLIPLLTEETLIDVSDYRKRLALLWSSKYDKPQEAIKRINLLDDAFHYGPGSDRPQVAALLAEYLLFYSNIERNFACFSSAFHMANKALKVVDSSAMPYITAKAHYMQGYATYERWHASSQRDPETLRRVVADMGKASIFLKEAKPSEGTSSLGAAILELWAGSAIHLAQDLKDKSLSLDKIKLAARVLTSAERVILPDPFFFKIDQNWLHIGRARALIAAKDPNSALAELGKVPSGNVKKLRRFLTAAIVEAEAYRAMDKIDMAAAYTLAALETAKELKADLHIARIDALCRDMRSEEKYQSSPELMRLGVAIVKAQYPDFF